jgi:hypothetical protein
MSSRRWILVGEEPTAEAAAVSRLVCILEQNAALRRG